MNEGQAISLLNDTFNNPFDVTKYAKFLKELLNTTKVNLEPKTTFVKSEFKEYVEDIMRVGKYTDPEGNSIELLAVKLARHSSLERARTMQRNFVAKWLQQRDVYTGAIVAFYDDESDWRFSFVKLEYDLVKDEKGKLKAKTVLTPAKRYSFLVGPNEPNHTCRKQFKELLKDTKDNPRIEEIESAFGIERVTKEFFEKYKDHYLKLKESLENAIKKDSNVEEEFKRIVREEDMEEYIIEFSKKLLGQIVFLYFLQKKGWLGIQKDENGKWKEWGTGPKDFMKKLFEGKYGSYDNFFNDVLEPLFYNTLAVKRDKDYADKFKCKIPFLNGGLFEPLDGYNWQETNIEIGNEIFEEIFKTFDEFNFTVKEDEPLEKEVAVDPEMLGKVFENLLEVKDRKSSGAFYTPREIVHYMCQQSLINYLDENTTIPREDIQIFIEDGDLLLDQTIKAQEQKKKYAGTSYVEENKTLPKSIEENHEEVDSLLKNIKVVDPAVGSGAFPIGMLNEIVKARSILSVYFSGERNTSQLKRECIENSLYGVDIMPSAVDICQLRFWLSLVVDEVDRNNIEPLPNLDNKIMCGNSLLQEFEGIQLFDDKLLGDVEKRDYLAEIRELQDQKNELLSQDLSKDEYDRKEKKMDRKIREIKKEIRKDTQTRQITLGEATQRRIKKSTDKLRELKKLQSLFFNEHDQEKKKNLASQIENIEWELIEITLKEQGDGGSLERLEQIKKRKSKPFFLWKLYFAEVFQRKNPGFDVVIANPPYVFTRNAEFSDDFKDYVQRKYLKGMDSVSKSHARQSGKINLYSLFIIKGLQLLRNEGVMSFIVPNNLLRTTTYDVIRKYILDTSKILQIVDLGEGVFKDVTASTVVVLFEKENNIIKKENNHIKIISDIESLLSKQFSKKSLYQKEFLNNTSYTFNITADSSSYALFQKILKDSKKIGDITTIHAGGIATGPNKKEMIESYQKDDRYKPLLEGKDIKPYLPQFSNKYILYEKELLYRARDESIFLNPEKIVTQRIGGGNRVIVASYDNNQYYTFNSTNTLLSKDKTYDLKYLVALLNSKLLNWFYVNKFTNKSKLTVNISKTFLSQLPIKELSLENQKPFIKLVNQIISVKEDNDYQDNADKQEKVKHIEERINQLVYKLYNLTTKDIKIIEEFNNK